MTFWSGVRLCEVVDFGFVGVLFFLIAECYLNGFVAICFFGLDLSNGTRTGLNDGAGCLLSISAEDTGHTNFFSNDTFHCLSCLCLQGQRDIPLQAEQPDGFQSP